MDSSRRDAIRELIRAADADGLYDRGTGFVDTRPGPTHFDDYQAFTRSTAIYPTESKIQALTYLALGLNGEAGEVADKIKKALRDNRGGLTGAVVTDLLKEVGDALWYIARLADELGFDLSEVAQMNVDKLLGRKARGVLGGSGDNR